MKFLFIGNPGTGKSTLINGIIGEAKFKSGNSFGQGLTTRLQLERDNKTGIWYGDTPGLSDVKLRKQAAEEITNALKSGDDDYKLIFVVTEEAGRVRPADVSTMTCVLDAIAREDSTSIPPYGIIVNKVTKKKKTKLYSDPSAMSTFTTCLNNDKYATIYIHFYEKNDDLEDEDNQVHKVSPDLTTFLEGLPSIPIKPEDVKNVRIDEYEALLEEMEDKVNALLEDKEQMDEKMKENEERLTKQVEEAKDKLDKKIAEKDKEMAMYSQELKKMKNQNAESFKKLEEMKEERRKEREQLEKMKEAMQAQDSKKPGNFLDALEAIGSIVAPVPTAIFKKLF